MGDPRYGFGMDFIDMYKNEVGASLSSRIFTIVMKRMQCKSSKANQYGATNTDPL